MVQLFIERHPDTLDTILSQGINRMIYKPATEALFLAVRMNQEVHQKSIAGAIAYHIDECDEPVVVIEKWV